MSMSNEIVADVKPTVSAEVINEANAAGDHERREETGQRELQRSSSEASAREACFS